MGLDCTECKCKNEIDYTLNDAWRILRDVSVVLFQRKKQLQHVRARIHIILDAEKRVLNAPTRYKRLAKIDEGRLLQRVKITKWTIAIGIEKTTCASLRNFITARK